MADDRNDAPPRDGHTVPASEPGGGARKAGSASHWLPARMGAHSAPLLPPVDAEAELGLLIPPPSAAAAPVPRLPQPTVVRVAATRDASEFVDTISVIEPTPSAARVQPSSAGDSFGALGIDALPPVEAGSLAHATAPPALPAGTTALDVLLSSAQSGSPLVEPAAAQSSAPMAILLADELLSADEPARMDESVPPEVPQSSVESVDLSARIEALRVILDKVHDEPASPAGPEQPMPRFLRDDPSDDWDEAPAPKPVGAPMPHIAAAHASARRRADDERHESSFDEPEEARSRSAPWIVAAAVAASIAALAGLAYLSVPPARIATVGFRTTPMTETATETSATKAAAPESPDRSRDEVAAEQPMSEDAPTATQTAEAETPPVVEPSAPEVAAPQPEPSFAFAGGCDGKPCEALVSAAARAMALQPVGHTIVAGPGLTVSAAPDAIDDELTGAEPPQTVAIRGLPQGARVSAGRRISASEWAVTLGDVAGVDIVLPPDAADKVRTTVELRERDGRQAAQFDLTIERERPVPPVAAKEDDADEKASGGADSPVAKAAEKVVEKHDEKRKRAAAKEQASVVKPKAKVKAAQRQKQPAAAAPAQAAAAAPPAQPKQQFQSGPPAVAFPSTAFGFGSGSGTGSGSSGSGAPSGGSTVFGFGGSSAGANANPGQTASEPAQPPRQRSRPPGFETLMGLGGGFAIENEGLE